MKTYIISHDKDLDGHASGQIAYDALADSGVQNIECIGWDYSYNASELLSLLEDDSDVYILDLSLPRDYMESLNENHNLIWIDHHKSAIEEMSDMQIGGIREVGRAACELAWEYFNPETPIPHIIFLLGKYDTWRKDDETIGGETFSFDDALSVNALFRFEVESFPSTMFSSELLSETPRKAIEIGRKKLNNYQLKNKSMAKAYSFVREIDGYRALCMNSNERNSGVFEGVYDEDLHDIMCCYFFDGKVGKWIHSLYSTKDDIDVSEIAKSFGGGGHKGAAGFQTGRPLYD